jgi:hypothetical protein
MSRQLDLRKQQRWSQHIQRWQHTQLTIRDVWARHQLSELNFYGTCLVNTRVSFA